MYTQYDYNNALCHYGVKGMKWGVRHDKPSTGRKRYSRSKSQSTLNRKWDGLSDKQKRAIKIGAAVSLTGLAIYGGYKLHNYRNTIAFGRTSLRFGSSKFALPEKVGRSYDDLIDPETRAMITSINADNKGLGGDNCSQCCVSYLLNSLFGENTTARIDVFDGLRPAQVKNLFNNVKEKGYSDNYSRMPTVANMVKDIPNGSTGILYLNNAMDYRHAINYEKTKGGLITFIDASQDIVMDYNGFMSDVRVLGFQDFSNATINEETEQIIRLFVRGH